MENEKTNEINIMDILLTLKKHIVAIIAVSLVMAIGAFAYTKTMVTPLYRSSTKLLIKAFTEEAMTVYTDSTSRIMLVNNCIEVLSGTEVMDAVVNDLELDITPEQLQSCISISSPEETLALKISVTHWNAETAKEIASQMVVEAEQVLAKDVGVAAMSVIQVAKTPSAPISPNYTKNTLVGAFLGAVLASAIVLIIRFVNNKIYSSEDAERILGITVLSSIPQVNENTTVSQQTNVLEEQELI